jgi:signal transduction histidine kinase
MESFNSFLMTAFTFFLNNLISILIFIIAFLIGIIFFFIFSKPKVKKIDVNFLDDIAFENDATALSNMVIQRVIKDYKFSSYSYMFINSAEVDFSIYLSEKVPDAYIDDVKRKIFDSLIESGIDPAVENKKVNLRKDGQPTDNNSRKALIDSFQVPILVNDILIGVFCFGSTSYLSESKNSILDIYEGVRRKFSDFSKYLGELQEDKDRFEDLINSMRNPVAMLGKNFELMYINPSFQELLKLSSDKDFNILDFSKNMPKNLDFEKTLQDVLVTATPKIFKNINYRGFIYDISFFPVIKSAKTSAVSILFQEVTSEYQNEKIKQEFTAMLIHELRAPLTVIKSSADLLQKRFKDLEPAKLKKFLTSIYTSSDGMLNLVSDLLDTSKLEMDKLQVTKRVSSLNSFLQERASFFQSELEAKKIKLIISLDNKIEEYSFDENKFTQVVNNLMSNAVKYTEKGYIKVSSKLAKDHIEIDFEDTGPGVPDEQKSKLFNKFTQLEASIKNKSRGTGLGLVVVKGIINAHGGDIKVLDNKPRGTIFRIILPLIS